MKIDLLRKEECIAYIEFNVTGDNDNYIRCHSESLYLKNEVFNLFTGCFERSHELYEYFGATKYNSRKIIPLKNELEKNLHLFENIQDFESFKKHVNSIFLGYTFFAELAKDDKNCEKKWKTYLNSLININKQLIDLIIKSIENERVLWVIGL